MLQHEIKTTTTFLWGDVQNCFRVGEAPFNTQQTRIKKQQLFLMKHMTY